MEALPRKTVAILATDGVEEAELVEPKLALEQAGITAVVVAPHGGTLQAMHHDKTAKTIPVDTTLNMVDPAQFDAVLLPGGALNADTLRMDALAKTFIQKMNAAQKPLFVICHAPWLLISAGLAKGRTLTSYFTIQDDLRNAGATWEDKPVVVDKNVITSRQPADIPQFNNAMLQALAV